MPNREPRQARSEDDGQKDKGGEVEHESAACTGLGDQRTLPTCVAVLTHTRPVVLSDGVPRNVTRSLYVFCDSMQDAKTVERSLKLGLRMESWRVVSSVEDYENAVEYKKKLFSRLFTHTTQSLSYISFVDSEGEECRLVCLNPAGADGLKVLRESLAEVRAIPNVSDVQLQLSE